jgi:hypothetical protein
LQTLTGRFLEQATGHRFGDDVGRWRSWWEGVQGSTEEKTAGPDDAPAIQHPVEPSDSEAAESSG